MDHGGFQLLVDPGYATLPRLLEISGVEDIDAVLVSHGHPDHCADLNPLLRARALRDDPAPPLAVYALADAVSKVLALDRPGMLEDAYTLREFSTGRPFTIGPFAVETWLLPHFVPNAGLRLSAGGKTLAYTGDTGPSPDLLNLASGADLSSPRQRSSTACPRSRCSIYQVHARLGRTRLAPTSGTYS